jgi:SAM-dependent methyltransferase
MTFLERIFTATTPDDTFARTYLSGHTVFGDDFTLEQIAAWFAEEENGYFNLTEGMQLNDQNGWSAVHDLHFFRHISHLQFDTCVALGSANGSDIKPLAHRVGRYIVIEPAEQWWRAEIGGTSCTYLKPAISGDIPLEQQSVDLTVCFGVLHHIPNVSHVLSEISRICKDDALFLLREPIYSMGDWRLARRGLTKNERGLPLAWLESKIGETEFSVIRRSFCALPPFARICERLGLRRPYSSKIYTQFDSAISRWLPGKAVYHRDTVFKKFSPSSACYILRRNARSKAE